MPGWHTRLWRRVKIAPGVSINFSKSGPSVSVGPRGAKITVGRRGVRQTVGIPGTGIYATRQLSQAPGEPTTPPEPGVEAASEAAPDAAPLAGAPAVANTQPAYGLAIAAGMIFGVALALIGLPSSRRSSVGNRRRRRDRLRGTRSPPSGSGRSSHPDRRRTRDGRGQLIGLVAVAALAGGLATSTRSGRRRRGG